MSTQIVTADTRGRITLGSESVGRQYRTETTSEGIITLTPMIAISDAESRVLQTPEALRLLREDPEAQVARSVPRPTRRKADH